METIMTCFTCHGITRPMSTRINGGIKMAPMFRTCCGFLQIHAACKVGNPRLCLKTGLNAGSKSLYRLPAIQVREFKGISLIMTNTGKVYMIFSPPHVSPERLIQVLLELDYQTIKTTNWDLFSSRNTTKRALKRNRYFYQQLVSMGLI